MADEERKLQSVDLNELQLEDDDLGSDFNPDADAFSGPPPPPDGIAFVKLRLFKGGDTPTGFSVGQTRNGDSYIMARIEARIVDEGGPFHDRPLFDRQSTAKRTGSGTCGIAGVLKALGEAVPRTIGKRELAVMLRDVLEQEPMCRIEHQWQGRAQTGTDDNGRPIYRTVKRGMKKFPQNEDGSYNHVFEHDGEEVVAQATILRYLPAEEES